ncbi:hypothetical protein BOTBODRAFT_246512 [Botryobasidium botryosum FD-172 SS1]|uniref:Uncharacterized protein n=1 Tax=Botryobasidium botryosum (strain FD-172 SS1) TaxID=930990 RepID=A0A067M4T4_BOTB1|nr:hypothetical protein BOTBODRAFT_246512 [Botryobasidium botryosum FD-172 SS1]
MREMGNVFDAGWVDRLAGVLRNVKDFESDGRRETWAKTARARRAGKGTMGFHLSSSRSVSPTLE